MIRRSSASAQQDSTAPTITVSLLDRYALNARYDNGERVGQSLEPTRSFHIVVRQDTRKVSLLFAAHDPESGINYLNWSFQLSFVCHDEQGSIGRHVDIPLPATVPGSFRAARSDVEAPMDAAVVGEFDLQTLWDRGGCRDWSQADHNLQRGRIDQFSVTYSSQAWNNAAPRWLMSPTLRGSFTGDGATVIVVPAVPAH